MPFFHFIFRGADYCASYEPDELRSNSEKAELSAGEDCNRAKYIRLLRKCTDFEESKRRNTYQNTVMVLAYH